MMPYMAGFLSLELTGSTRVAVWPRSWRRLLALYLVGLFVTTLSGLARDTSLVAMADGIRLSTDVYLPAGEGPWPVIFLRTPYVKANGNYEKIALPWTKEGWALVVQDTRGRGASEGDNFAYEADGWADHHQDGADTLRWIVTQRWCDGHVVTAGHSASGILQLLLAGTGEGPLSAQHISSGVPSLFAGIYRQGVFRKTLVEDWLKKSGYDPAMLQLWISHSHYDEFWAARDLEGRYSQINTPAVHVGGWFDIFTQGALDSFAGYNEQGGPHARGQQRLVMGPWTHAFDRNLAGELVFPNAAKAPARVANPRAWFDYVVRGTDNGIAGEPHVTYYVMGDTTDRSAPGNFWRSANQWPRIDSTTTALYLHSDKRAKFELPPAEENSLGWDADPDHPVPTVGGPQLPGTSLLAGPMDQAAVESRNDVLVFSTDPLPQPIEVTGRLSAKLWISSDAPDTDLVVRVCIVGADGKSYNLLEGAIRARFRESLRNERLLEPNKIYPLEIDLWSTSMVFNRGNRIRVHVTSSSSPGYEVNPNNGLPLQAPGQGRVAHNRIYLDANHPSQILLPVAPFQVSESR